MNIKQRVESKELKVYRILKNRKVLTVKEAEHLDRLEKGYEGEVRVDERVEKLSKEWLVLNDLQLEINNSEFQIDSVIIAQKTFLMFEIKNYEGDYYMEDDGQWYYINGTQIHKPVSQLERSEVLLRRLLRDHDYNIPIESYLIFVNPDFHMYNAPRNPKIIFPNQLNRFFDKLNKVPSYISEHHQKLAHKLFLLQKKESRFKKIPKYDYEELRKGVTCILCHCFYKKIEGSTLICACGNIEEVKFAVLRCIKEYRLLFPNRKITTSNISEWCNGIKSKRTIQRILSNNFKHILNGKSSHFIEK
ncbi:NERD domain-containing protein [Bacillus sp. FJAT-49711]|uniref:nuclease-related domain-containing protein n=1 Tax=Bacillus sp. FJAT-49711 TaxID=2833585 RepID=UPI001BC9FC93|nr:nuclease-related domain-containing protein [Bacillus sp. FJAT-49711]MBS4216824.1 NERD domain-containing protein [Bacillus sp. FJAT-49711]